MHSVGTTSAAITVVVSVPVVLGIMRSACSLAKSREKSATAAFSFWRTGVVPCLVLARLPVTDPL